MAVRYSEREARAAVADSHCWTEALRKLGMCPTGGGATTLKKWVARWNISTSHFNPYAGRGSLGIARRVPLEEILIEGSSFSRGHLKKRLYESGLKAPICELCGQGEVWRERTMALILDVPSSAGSRGSRIPRPGRWRARRRRSSWQTSNP